MSSRIAGRDSPPLSLPISMDLLRALVAFAESPSLTEAARALGISQPALSLQLQRLERDLPQAVFGMEGKRKVLTRYGRSLYRVARKSLSRLEASIEKLNRAYATPESLTLKIGARRDFIHRVAPLIRFPGQIVFLNLSVEEAIRGLHSHSVDMAISYDRPDSPELVARELFTLGVRLVVHERWLGGRKLTPALARDPGWLRATPVLFYRKDAPMLSQWLSHAGVEVSGVRPRYVCEDWLAMMRLIEEGAGYSLVPEDIEAAAPSVASLQAVPIPYEIVKPVTYYALYHRELRKIPAYRNFLEFRRPET